MPGPPPDPTLDPSLELVGLGHDGIIYAVSQDIVLKAARTFDVAGLSEDAQQRLRRDQSRSTKMLAAERRGLQKVGSHANIVSAIALDYPEGMYLVRYDTDIDLFLEKNGKPPLPTRLNWYVAVTRALLYLHDRKMMHADVHEANMLCDEQGLHVALCDFPTATIWGDANAHDGRRAGEQVRDPFDVCDDRLDRFLAAKFMLRCECGNEAGEWLRYTEEHEVQLTRTVRTGNVELDEVITNGVLAKYKETRAMLESLEDIARKEGVPISPPDNQSVEHEAKIARLQVEVAAWRRRRLQSYGYVIKEELR